MVEKLITEVLFEDDCAIMVRKENHKQTLVKHFVKASRFFGLTINLEKIEVLAQADTIHPHPYTTTDATRFNCVESFRYLGNTISANESVDSAVSSRIRKASYLED